MQTYDPTKVTVILGDITLGQFAKGTFVTVSRVTDAYTDEVGVNGEVVRIRSGDQRGEVKVTVMRASQTNDALSALAQLDELTGGGIRALLVKDLTGTSLHSAQNAWVMKIPDAPYSTEAESIEWTIRCERLNHTVGGTNLV